MNFFTTRRQFNWMLMSWTRKILFIFNYYLQQLITCKLLKIQFVANCTSKLRTFPLIWILIVHLLWIRLKMFQLFSVFNLFLSSIKNVSTILQSFIFFWVRSKMFQLFFSLQSFFEFDQKCGCYSWTLLWSQRLDWHKKVWNYHFNFECRKK